MPFLRYLRITSGWRARAALLLGLYAANIMISLKVISEPFHLLTLAITFPLALVSALFLFFAYMVWDYTRSKQHSLSVLVLPASVSVSEWILYTFTDFAPVFSIAYTQVENLQLMQLASITGLVGVSFLMYWTSAILEEVLSTGKTQTYRWHIIALIAVLISVHLFGSIRLNASSKGKNVKVAAVLTDSIIIDYHMAYDIYGSPQGIEEIRRSRELLFERSKRAAELGAKMIAWNETATIVKSDEESALLERGKTLARQYQVDLIMAYFVLPSNSISGVERARIKPPKLKLYNKLTWIRPDGTIAQEYLKHRTLPLFEVVVKGKDPLRVLKTDVGNVAIAICYDYDFSNMALKHSRLGADLVLLSSSDWRAISHTHVKMFRVRAIEGGFSLLVSASGSISAGFDQFGRVRGWIDHYEDNDRVLVVSLPVQRVRTIYSVVGDTFAYLCILIMASAIFSRVIRARTKIQKQS